MLSIRDYTDGILCKAIHLQNEEEIGRMEVVQKDFKRITEHNTMTIMKVLEIDQIREEFDLPEAPTSLNFYHKKL